MISLAILGEWSFYGIFRCPFAVPYIGCGNCPVTQCPGRSLWLWSWVLILASALLFGRAFCGYACPGGLVSEVFSIFSFMRSKIKGLLDKALNFGKYIVLALSLYYFFILNNPRWAIPIRTGEFFKSVALTFEHANSFWIYKTVAILAALAISIVIPMFWCRYLCPTGGAIEIVSKLAFLRFSMNEKCTDCDQCRNRCAIETRPDESNCTNCGDCLSACRPGAIELKRLI